MLKPEQARVQLAKVRQANGVKRRLTALASLPQKIAEIGRGLLGRDARGKAVTGQLRDRTVQAAGVRLDGLGPRDRRPLFEALFPRLGLHVDAAWELGRHLPYQGDYDRKPFRVPHDPELSRSARLRWLVQLLEELEGYEQDVTWLAAWAGFLSHGYSADAASIVLAAAINSSGKERQTVVNILCATGHGSHPIGSLGRYVIRALLVAGRVDGWVVVGNLLLAARSEEGLRQTILETIDEAHPEAFRCMLRMIVDNDQARFNATVRAVNAWFGFQWDAVSVKVVNRVLEQAWLYLGDPTAQARALESDDAESVYLALWTMAFEDAVATVEPAAALLKDPNVERRFLAVHLLGQLQLPAAGAHLLAALDDADLRVALCALDACEREEAEADGQGLPRPVNDMFERLERLLARMPEEKTQLAAIIWPWQMFSADRQTVTASLIDHLGKRPPTILIPHLPGLESWARRLLVEKLEEQTKWDEQTRDTLLTLAGDSSITVREAALGALKKCKITEAEAKRLEEYLTRKPGDLRRGVIALLLGQGDAAALASIDRLLGSGQPLPRQAGLELLRQLSEAGRAVSQCQTRAEAYGAGRNGQAGRVASSRKRQK